MAFWDITTIKYVYNETDGKLSLENFEDPNQDELVIKAHKGKRLNWWVPRADTATQFKQNRIEIRLLRANAEDPVISVWVQEIDGDDRVRYSRSQEEGKFEHGASSVDGFSKVGGDRILVVHENGEPEVDRLG